jgi:hypothetical protein
MKIVQEVPEKTIQSGTSTDSLRVEHRKVDALVILEAKYTVDREHNHILQEVDAKCQRDIISVKSYNSRRISGDCPIL